MKTNRELKRTSKSGRICKASVAARVAEAAWQPWLLPKEVSQRIIRLIPPGYRNRFRFCFDDYGCFRCGRKDVPYRAIGFCQNCHSRITKYMQITMKRHRRELCAIKTSPRIKWYIEEVSRAEELLADFRARKDRPTKCLKPT